METYNIIQERRHLNGELEDTSFFGVDDNRVPYENDYLKIFTKQQTITLMVDLLLENCENITYVDQDYIQEEIEDDNDTSWFCGEGFYTITPRKRFNFEPLVDVVEVEKCGKIYRYYAHEIGE